MPPRRESPLPKLPISLEALPPPENVRRGHRLALSLTDNELAMIEQAAQGRGEQSAVFCRTVVLTAFQNSALRALGQKPDLLELSPTEQQQLLLEAFTFDDKPSRRERSAEKGLTAAESRLTAVWLRRGSTGRAEERPGESSGLVVSVVWTLPLFDCRQADWLEAEAQWTGALAAFERLAEAEPPRRGRRPFPGQGCVPTWRS